MNPRLLAVVLRLLPRAAYQSTDNPLQVERLPDQTRVEFDYPVYQDPPAAARRQTALLIFTAALAAPVLAWLCTLLPITLFQGGLRTLLMMAATVCLMLGALGHRWPFGAYIGAALSLPVVATLVLDESLVLAAVIPAVIGTWLLADRLGTFYWSLKTAAPVAKSRSLAARALWRNRWHSLIRVLRGTEWYPLNFLIFFVPVLCVWQQERAGWPAASDPRQMLDLFAKLTVAGLVCPFALEIVLAPLYGRRPYGLWRLLRAFANALVEWCSYNRLNTHGVGIHRSPAGSCGTRRLLLIGVILVWTCVWIYPTTTRPDWLRTAAASIRWNTTGQAYADEPRSLFSDADQSAESRPPQPVSLPPLTEAEQKMLTRMTPERAAAYRQERERLATEASRAQQQHEQTRQATQKTAYHLLQLFAGIVHVTFRVLEPSLGTALASLVLVFGASARALAGAEDLFGSAQRQRILRSENWEQLVERVRGSRDPWEQRSLFLGTNMRDDTPVLVPREVFEEHAHILGDSGSGKTSIGLMPLVSQLLRSGDCSVVVIDLKADDQALFETLRREAARHADYPFRWFTTTLGRASYIFNPLTQRFMSQLPDYQRTDLLIGALGLHYGTEYGRKFYGDANYDLLNYAITQNPDIESFVELAEILNGAARFPFDKDTKRAASHVRSAIRRQARCQSLNGCRSLKTPQAALDQAIDLDDLFSQPQALYFALPPSSGVTNTAEIARLVLHAMLAAAQCHAGPRKQVFLVIDEFQRIVASNLSLFLQTARSMNIGVILSNQSLDDLETADASLIPAVCTNTRFRQVFAAGHRSDILHLRDTAGEAMVGLRAWDLLPSLLWGGVTVDKINVRETTVSRLMLNDILLATDAFGRNIVSVRRGAGYAQFGGLPFVMDSVHHIPFHVFEELRDTKWPEPDAETNVPPLALEPSIPPGGGQVLDDDDADDELDGTGSDDAPDPDSSSGLDDELRDVLEEQQQRQADKRRRQRRNNQEPSSKPFPFDGDPLR